MKLGIKALQVVMDKHFIDLHMVIDRLGGLYNRENHLIQELSDKKDVKGSIKGIVDELNKVRCSIKHEESLKKLLNFRLAIIEIKIKQQKASTENDNIVAVIRDTVNNEEYYNEFTKLFVNSNLFNLYVPLYIDYYNDSYTPIGFFSYFLENIQEDKFIATMMKTATAYCEMSGIHKLLDTYKYNNNK